MLQHVPSPLHAQQHYSQQPRLQEVQLLLLPALEAQALLCHRAAGT